MANGTGFMCGTLIGMAAWLQGWYINKAQFRVLVPISALRGQYIAKRVGYSRLSIVVTEIPSLHLMK